MLRSAAALPPLPAAAAVASPVSGAGVAGLPPSLPSPAAGALGLPGPAPRCSPGSGGRKPASGPGPGPGAAPQRIPGRGRQPAPPPAAPRGAAAPPPRPAGLGTAAEHRRQPPASGWRCPALGREKAAFACARSGAGRLAQGVLAGQGKAQSNEKHILGLLTRKHCATIEVLQML
ncbi:skin secretory protein xP2-like isoform X1 [Numida meleagris]|uniref:skin secretory protein xP2-like isoform X1 n=1 Tax=Numida meleagris TaxID=8996 RepID=UPI000B3E020C|nr:skin secretory protein xP2-like isoform X1 [Numida meleagris]XP_021252103.1 skin secretory protein xP2-like isoform X1 [Numida meleagris]